MNILTFDIEEWYVEKYYRGDRKEKYKDYDKYLSNILDILDKKSLKATFFCVGKLANDFPHVIRSISERGHEIGCHSNEHLWLTKMTPKQMLIDTRTAIMALEDCSGKNVLSYRAPAFSVCQRNKWALEILAECGIERDSSIYPTHRDFGGYSEFTQTTPSIINIGSVTIKEFPIPLYRIGNNKLAYSGGVFSILPILFYQEKHGKIGLCDVLFSYRRPYV